MKIIERKTVARNKYGRVAFDNHNLEEHEKGTIFYLAKFGFDVEALTPSYVPKSNNPDLLMLGTTWEMKGPLTSNKNTIKKRFRKAVKQSGGRSIFDLRRIQCDDKLIEDFILELFVTTRGMESIMIIKKDGSLLDIFK